MALADDCIIIEGVAGTSAQGVIGGVPFANGTAGADVIDCWAASAGHNIDGKGGDDVIFGSAFDDKIVGGGGNDILNGHEGNDCLIGDQALTTGPCVPDNAATAGDDKLGGGPGFDELHGGPGHDHLGGGQDDDFLFG